MIDFRKDVSRSIDDAIALLRAEFEERLVQDTGSLKEQLSQNVTDRIDIDDVLNGQASLETKEVVNAQNEALRVVRKGLNPLIEDILKYRSHVDDHSMKFSRHLNAVDYLLSSVADQVINVESRIEKDTLRSEPHRSYQSRHMSRSRLPTRSLSPERSRKRSSKTKKSSRKTNSQRDRNRKRYPSDSSDSDSATSEDSNSEVSDPDRYGAPSRRNRKRWESRVENAGSTPVSRCSWRPIRFMMRPPHTEVNG